MKFVFLFLLLSTSVLGMAQSVDTLKTPMKGIVSNDSLASAQTPNGNIK